MRNRLILWLVLLLVGFLAGFVPQYRKAQRANAELASVKQDLSGCQAAQRLSQLRDSAALMYLETTQKNFGLAGEHAAQFFDGARQMAEQTADPALRATLQDLAKSRDTVITALAKGDPAVVPELQAVLTKTERDVKR